MTGLSIRFQHPQRSTVPSHGCNPSRIVAPLPVCFDRLSHQPERAIVSGPLQAAIRTLMLLGNARGLLFSDRTVGAKR